MEKVQAEIDLVVGRSRLPTTEDRKSMPYTEAVICEVLRYSSIVVGAILHSTSEDTTLRGFELPKGSIVMANLYNVHHDPETWKDPENFRPERFLEINKTEGSSSSSPTSGKPNSRQKSYEGVKYTFVKNESLVPFSVGKRICLAETMAQTEFFLFLSGLLQHFDFRFVDDNNIPSIDDVCPGLVHSPKPFKIIATERL